jgi:hypothetical protein
MLGSAAFRSEKWETAVKAFRSCTHLDPEVILFYFYKHLSYILKIPKKLIESRNMEQSCCFVHKIKSKRQSSCRFSRGSQSRLRELESLGEFLMGNSKNIEIFMYYLAIDID